MAPLYDATAYFQPRGKARRPRSLTDNAPMIIRERGPEEILEILDPSVRLTAFIVIDSTRLGPAHGGIRIRRYDSEREALLDALDLASAMTLKAALAGLDSGGGKIVMMDRPGLRRARAIDLVAEALNDLRGRFFAGPDYGMTPRVLARLRRYTRHAAADRVCGGLALADATALGTLAAIRGALAVAPGGARRSGLRGIEAAIQGLGAVGLSIARMLLQEGARVAGTDTDPCAARRGAALGVRILSSRRLASLQCELFVPAAVGGTVDEPFARTCRARIVCGPANNQLSSPQAERILRERRVLFVPDIVASAGAVVAGVLPCRTDPRPIIARIGPRTVRILREAARTGATATEVARRRAEGRVRRGR